MKIIFALVLAVTSAPALADWPAPSPESPPESCNQQNKQNWPEPPLCGNIPCASVFQKFIEISLQSCLRDAQNRMNEQALGVHQLPATE
jgi:hypothetical protein